MTPIPMTIPELIECIEQLFDCRDGPYQSYVEHEGKQYPYVTLVRIAKSDKHHSDEYVRARLRSWMHAEFFSLARKLIEQGRGVRPVLYWRFAPEERIGEESRKLRKYSKHLLRTRIAVPAAHPLYRGLDPYREGDLIPELKL